MAAERVARPRRWWRAGARLAVAAILLAVLAVRIGGAAFARGVGSITVPVVLAAIALTLVSTLCAAWRWRAVARQLGAPLQAGHAVAAYYRSQFLNSVLPGGVAGDAHRAVAHGRDVDDVGRAARAVVWERTAGQVVQAAVAIAVLAVLPSPGRRWVPVLLVILAGAVLTAWCVARRDRGGSSWPARVLASIGSDLREVTGRRTWPVLVVASLGVVAAHVALFVLVAHTVDPVSIRALLPLAVIVQIATGLPLSVAGWGLREGTAAWAFAAAGLGAATGVTAATAYGLVSLVAVLPGLVVLGLELGRGGPVLREFRRRRVPRREVVLHG